MLLFVWSLFYWAKIAAIWGLFLVNHILLFGIVLKIIQRFFARLTSDHLIFISLGLSIITNVFLLEMDVIGDGISGPSITGLPSDEILFLYWCGIFVLPFIFYFVVVIFRKSKASDESNQSGMDNE